MILPVYLYGHPVLRKMAQPITKEYPKLQELIANMWETMYHSEGVGLAAPQVGVLRRIFIVMYEDFFCECINPVITMQKGSQTDTEGCSSVKGKYGTVTRPNEIKVKAFDRFGNPFEVKAKGFLARIFCHENDHLDGILYVDKATDIGEDN